MTKGDILFDVFAGIGPFAIPSAKKQVLVYANDLNPHSHSAMVENVKLNKVKPQFIHTFNMDGREFINTVVRKELVSIFINVQIPDKNAIIDSRSRHIESLKIC